MYQLTLIDQTSKPPDFILSRSFGGRINALEHKISLQVADSKEDLPTREQLSDFLTFQRYFFKLRTHVDFRISQPDGRVSHHRTLAGLAPKIFNQEINRLMINIAPRYGKSEWAIAMIAYGLAFYPKSRYMYISKDSELSIKHCKYIKQIVSLPEFRKIFGLWVVSSNSKGGNMTFTLNTGGEVYAVGSGGGIAGRGAGLQNIEEFGGFCLIDDFHKIDEVTSDTVREHAAETYVNSILNRLNNPAKTPIICIGQITHEDDLPTRLKEGKHDFYDWYTVELPSLQNNRALYPEMHTLEMLLKMQDTEPYMFSAQHQQKATPAGGSLFREDRFVLHSLTEIKDRIVYTFVTVDGAETEETWNDATAMSFFGMYKILDEVTGIETDEWGMHILDCIEDRVLPDKIESMFNDFWAKCCLFKVKPKLVGVEKKSSGVTLLAFLEKRQGIEVVDTIPWRQHKNESDTISKSRKNSKIIKGKKNSGKINRFIACQKYAQQRYISLTEGMNYTNMVIKHMGKITANNTHRHDDIADTISDAIHMTYITGYVFDKIMTQQAANLPQAKHYAPLHTGGIKW